MKILKYQHFKHEEYQTMYVDIQDGEKIYLCHYGKINSEDGWIEPDVFLHRQKDERAQRIKDQDLINQIDDWIQNKSKIRLLFLF
jgi:hypothetical protein